MTEIRKRRSEAEYRKLFAEHGRSGLTLRAFAESSGINPQTFYAWHRRMQCATPQRVLETVDVRPVQVVGVTEPAREPPQTFEVTIANDCVISVPAGFDANELGRLLAVLGSRC